MGGWVISLKNQEFKMSDNLKKTADKKLSEMFNDINAVNIDELKSSGFTVRIGNQIIKLTPTEFQNVTIEDEIREEFRLKLSERLTDIKDKLNNKIIELVNYTNKIKDEADRKEREYEERIKNACVMPNVTLDHAKKGLSCVKGDQRDEIIWLIQGIYWPQTVGAVTRKKIEPKYSMKMISNIIFKVVTQGKIVKRVSTHKPIGLDYFEHYHQSRPDCWGQWKAPKEFNGPEDIIKIAKDAEAVLQNVNPSSLASRSPFGLPRFSTLERHLVESKNQNSIELRTLSQSDARQGITTGSDDTDVWTL